MKKFEPIDHQLYRNRSFNDAEESYLQIIENLSSDLADYSTKPDANERYIKRQENLIKVLKYYHEVTLARMDEIYVQVLSQGEKIENDNLMIDKLIVIAFHHGIDNLEWLVNRPLSTLIAEYNQACKEGWRQKPFAFLDFKIPQL